MSNLFRRRSSAKTRSTSFPSLSQTQQAEEDQNSGYLSLLGRISTSSTAAPPYDNETTELACGNGAFRVFVAQAHESPYSGRRWLSAAENHRHSWTGERPPTRKLVKEPHGSGRPSFSLELNSSDSDGEKDKGLVRRQFDRLKGLYRRDEKPGP